jgi:hypothetical protein
MKSVILRLSFTCFLVACMGLSEGCGQGIISINNMNGGGTLTSTNFGLFFDTGGGANKTPINVTILGGPDANSLAPIVTLAGPNALVAVDFYGGRYMDPSGLSYTVPGVAPGQPATLQILAWRGSASTFDSADIRQDVFWPFGGTSWIYPTLFTFTNPTGGATPASLDGMPGMWRLLDVPEPSASALVEVGIAVLVLVRGARRKAETSP